MGVCVPYLNSVINFTCVLNTVFGCFQHSFCLILFKQVFLICPSTVEFHHPSFKILKQFHPHLSMEDPPDLSSLFSSVQKRTITCTSSNQGGKYKDPASHNGYCRKETKMNENTKWRCPTWENVSSWIKSELSLNLYQYVNTNTVTRST